MFAIPEKFLLSLILCLLLPAAPAFSEETPGAADLLLSGGKAMKSRDFDTAKRDYLKACELGNAEGCRWYGFLHSSPNLMKNPATEDDFARGLLYLAKACDLGDAPSCAVGGKLAIDGGPGAAPDLSRGLSLYEKACDLGENSVCGVAGYLYSFRKENPDYEKGIPLMEKSCAGGEAAICAVLGELYEKGPSGVRNEARAQELFKKVCDLGMKRACEKLQK